jgi:hypothetical protein
LAYLIGHHGQDCQASEVGNRDVQAGRERFLASRKASGNSVCMGETGQAPQAVSCCDHGQGRLIELAIFRKSSGNDIINSTHARITLRMAPSSARAFSGSETATDRQGEVYQKPVFL